MSAQAPFDTSERMAMARIIARAFNQRDDAFDHLSMAHQAACLRAADDLRFLLTDLDEMRAQKPSAQIAQFEGTEILDLAACRARCLREWKTVSAPPCDPSDDDWQPCTLCDHDTKDNA